ncbi:MAG: high-potential iron-sulfur protein [Steroidobacteraceae bacterium]|jgi:hypothetical protein|nr:high-potential iron-sulfur protein [Steroidobacteraceae bacterium]
MNDKTLPRRALLKGALGLAAIPVVAAVATAEAQAQAAKPAGGAALPRLDPNSPQAKALAYVHDGSQIDRKAHPNFKPDQKCNNCIHWTGKPTDPWAGCNLFPGRSVAGPGWCRVWAKKP